MWAVICEARQRVAREKISNTISIPCNLARALSQSPRNLDGGSGEGTGSKGLASFVVILFAQAWRDVGAEGRGDLRTRVHTLVPAFISTKDASPLWNCVSRRSYGNTLE